MHSPPLLLGYASIRRDGGGRRYQFGPGDAPRLRIERSLGRFALTLALDGATMPHTMHVEAQGDVAFVTVIPDRPSTGRGTLHLEAVGDDIRWAIEWIADPEADGVLGTVRALRKQGRCEDAAAQLAALEATDLDPRARFWCAFERGRILRARGLRDETSRVWEGAAAIARDAGVDTLASRALRAAAYAAYQQRDFTRAIDLLERVRRIDLRADDVEGSINSEYYRGMIAAERGALVEARRHYDRATALGRRCGSSMVAFFETALSLLHVNLGEFDQARAIAARVRSRIESGPDDVLYQANERFTAAWVLLQCGRRSGHIDVPLIEGLLDEELERLQKSGQPQLEMMRLFNRAWLSWWTDDLAGTRRDLELVADRQRSFAADNPSESVLIDPEFELLTGRLQLAEGALDAAEATFDRLLEVLALECAGQPTLLSLGAWLGLSRIARRRGHLQDAADGLDRAMAIIAQLALDLDRRRTVTLLGERPLICDPVEVVDERIAVAEARGDLEAAFGTADALHALRRRALDQRSMLQTLSGAERAHWDRLGHRIDSVRAQYDDVRGDWRLSPANRSARLIALTVQLRELFDARLRLLEAPARAGARPTALGALHGLLRPDEALTLLRVRSRGDVEAWWIDRRHIERAIPLTVERWLEDRLDGVEHLYIVGDMRSGAWSLPRSRVHGEPLAARVGISFPGHAGALLHAPSAGGAGALVVADPRTDLPAARRDAERLAALVDDPRTLVGAEATRRAVLDGLAACGLLHFSGHGELEDEGVSLQLADRTSLRPEDVIGAHRVPGRVVLNGCRTAVGFADQAVSLAGAFLTAGSASVLGTVRPVEDERASAFIGQFYRSGGAADPAAGLRGATRWAIERGDDIWNAYRLMGRR